MSDDDDDLHNEEDEEDELPTGWDDLDAHLDSLLDSVPMHYGTTIKWSIGGPDPLDGLNIYKCSEPAPHWLYVGYGCSELYEKENDQPEWSGYGFEFTFRLERGAEEDPPLWPFNLMNNMARYVFDTGNCFAHGHRMELNSPILRDSGTDITCAMFALDPLLGAIDTCNGKVEFLQIVGVIEDEYRAAEGWNSKQFLALLEEKHPYFITKLDRRSILSDPVVARQVEEGIARDGSSCDSMHLTDVEVSVLKDRLQLTIHSSFVDGLKRLLVGRLKHQRELRLNMDGTNVYLEPSDKNEWMKTEEGDFVVSMTPALIDEILTKIEDNNGTYRFEEFPNFVIAAKDVAVV